MDAAPHAARLRRIVMGKSTGTRAGTGGIATALALAAIATGASAATLTYPGAAPCATTLQACVTGATAGDIIALATNVPIAEFVTVDKTLTIQPAPGFAPSVQGLFTAVSTTSISLTVQNLAGLNTVRAVLGPGGGNLSLTVLNTTINATGFNAGVEFTAGTGAAGAYGTATAVVSGNTIVMNGSGSCTDAIVIDGVPAGFTATVVNNDITVNNLTQCGGIDVVVGGGAVATATIDRNRIHGVDFDYGIVVRNFGNNPGQPGGLLTALVTNNLVYGQNGNTGAPGGLVASADGNNAALAVQLVNNTVADGRIGVLVSARTDLGASITGGLFNNILAFHSQYGIGIDNGLPGFANGHNLTYGNASPDFFLAGPVTLTVDPKFANRAAGDYTLLRGSPAIDTGLDSALPASVTQDLKGNPRRVGIVDIGAYEFFEAQIPALQPMGLALLAALVALGFAFNQRRQGSR
jgi:hypothetical protein